MIKNGLILLLVLSISGCLNTADRRSSSDRHSKTSVSHTNLPANAEGYHGAIHYILVEKRDNKDYCNRSDPKRYDRISIEDGIAYAYSDCSQGGRDEKEVVFSSKKTLAGLLDDFDIFVKEEHPSKPLHWCQSHGPVMDEKGLSLGTSPAEFVAEAFINNKLMVSTAPLIHSDIEILQKPEEFLVTRKAYQENGQSVVEYQSSQNSPSLFMKVTEQDTVQFQWKLISSTGKTFSGRGGCRGKGWDPMMNSPWAHVSSLQNVLRNISIMAAKEDGIPLKVPVSWSLNYQGDSWGGNCIPQFPLPLCSSLNRFPNGASGWFKLHLGDYLKIVRWGNEPPRPPLPSGLPATQTPPPVDTNRPECFCQNTSETCGLPNDLPSVPPVICVAIVRNIP